MQICYDHNEKIFKNSGTKLSTSKVPLIGINIKVLKLVNGAEIIFPLRNKM